MPSEVLASRYAEALAGAISEHDVLDQVNEELSAIAKVVEANRTFKAFIEGPNVRDEDKHAMMVKAFGGQIHSLCMDFVMLLIDKHRVDHLTATASAFQELVEARRRQIRVAVTTAIAMPIDMVDRLKRALDASTGHDCILDAKVDPKVIGGVVVQMRDRVIDGSVRAALEDMRQNLLHVAL